MDMEDKLKELEARLQYQAALIAVYGNLMSAVMKQVTDRSKLLSDFAEQSEIVYSSAIAEDESRHFLPAFEKETALWAKNLRDLLGVGT